MHEESEGAVFVQKHFPEVSNDVFVVFLFKMPFFFFFEDVLQKYLSNVSFFLEEIT